MASKLVLHQKIIDQEGGILEMKIWQVPKSLKNPDGVKYSLYWIQEGNVLVGYDNHHPKGHHRHYRKKEESYNFVNIENLIHDFLEDLRRLGYEG